MKCLFSIEFSLKMDVFSKNQQTAKSCFPSHPPSQYFKYWYFQNVRQPSASFHRGFCLIIIVISLVVTASLRTRQLQEKRRQVSFTRQMAEKRWENPLCLPNVRPFSHPFFLGRNLNYFKQFSTLSSVCFKSGDWNSREPSKKSLTQ